MSSDDTKSLPKQLDQLDTFFEVGDFKSARQLARQLLGSDNLQQTDRKRVRQVLTATRIDPVAIGAVVFTVALLLHLFVVYAV